jgi:hypothetical protein
MPDDVQRCVLRPCWGGNPCFRPGARAGERRDRLVVSARLEPVPLTRDSGSVSWAVPGLAGIQQLTMAECDPAGDAPHTWP